MTDGLEPGTLVKSLFTDRDTLEQGWDYGTVGNLVENHPGGQKSFVVWEEHVGCMMWPDEVEIVAADERLAHAVMRT